MDGDKGLGLHNGIRTMTQGEKLFEICDKVANNVNEAFHYRHLYKRIGASTLWKNSTECQRDWSVPLFTCYLDHNSFDLVFRSWSSVNLVWNLVWKCSFATNLGNVYKTLFASNLQPVEKWMERFLCLVIGLIGCLQVYK